MDSKKVPSARKKKKPGAGSCPACFSLAFKPVSRAKGSRSQAVESTRAPLRLADLTFSYPALLAWNFTSPGIIVNMCLGPMAAATAAKLLQSCPTLCNPRDCSPLGSSVHGILQARILEWVAISFSMAQWQHSVNKKIQLVPGILFGPRAASKG